LLAEVSLYLLHPVVNMKINVKITVFGDVKLIYVSQKVSSFWRTLLYPYSGWLKDGGIIKITRGK